MQTGHDQLGFQITKFLVFWNDNAAMIKCDSTLWLEVAPVYYTLLKTTLSLVRYGQAHLFI